MWEKSARNHHPEVAAFGWSHSNCIQEKALRRQSGHFYPKVTALVLDAEIQFAWCPSLGGVLTV